jgi:hypothetical protein
MSKTETTPEEAGYARGLRQAAGVLGSYLASYQAMDRVEPGCRVTAFCVAYDIERNMIGGILALLPKEAANV